MPRSFVDGGLANNDPRTIGLTVMLTAHPDTSIMKAAILSIGCGAGTYSSRWTPGPIIGRLPDLIGLAMNANGEDKASFLRVIYSASQLHQGGGWATYFSDCPSSVAHV